VAEAEGKRERGFAIIRTGSGQAPTPDADIAELGEGRVVAVASMLFAAPEVTLDRRDVDRTLDLTLTGSMANYDWGSTAPSSTCTTRCAARTHWSRGNGCGCG
jgi:hypothetical protein